MIRSVGSIEKLWVNCHSHRPIETLLIEDLYSAEEVQQTQWAVLVYPKRRAFTCLSDTWTGQLRQCEGYFVSCRQARQLPGLNLFSFAGPL